MNHYSYNYVRTIDYNSDFNLQKFSIKTNLFNISYKFITYFNFLQFNVKRYNELIRTAANIIKHIYKKHNYYFRMFITKNLIDMLTIFKENVLIVVNSNIKNIYKTIKSFVYVSKYNFINKKKANTALNVFPVYLNTDQIHKNLITNRALNCLDNLKNIQLLNYNNLLYTKNINNVNTLINKIFKKKLNNIQFDFYTKAKQLILGQENILIKIAAKLVNINNNKSNKPLANWLLCGPSGTGKTELAKILARYMKTNIDSLVHINMSELQERHSVSKFLGSPPGYAGNKEHPSEVVDKVIKNPESVVLFDEIEKAHKKIYPIFLQMLEDGTLTSSANVKASFSKAFVIFTSNLGSKALDKNNSNNVQKTAYRGFVTKEIERYFPPELINRLDDVLIFNPFGPYTSYKLLLNTIKEFKKLIYHRSIKLLTSVQLSSPLRGARFILNNIDKTFLNKKSQNNLIIKFDNNIQCLNLNR